VYRRLAFQNHQSSLKSVYFKYQTNLITSVLIHVSSKSDTDHLQPVTLQNTKTENMHIIYHYHQWFYDKIKLFLTNTDSSEAHYFLLHYKPQELHNMCTLISIFFVITYHPKIFF
jgi:uncharacterized protein YcfL